MKRITKSNLEELAKVMPVLSEEEQKEYVGGQVYELRQDGTLILIDSGNVGSVRIDAPGYGNKTGA
ncbi:MAG: hypothetical protein RR280_10520, partial [Bacteroidaceae bacterium]